MTKEWQVHGRAIKVLAVADAPSFDRRIVAFAASLVQREIDNMLEGDGPVTRAELANRLEVGRNRIPRLLDVLEIEFPQERDPRRDMRDYPQVAFYATNDSVPGIDQELTAFLRRRFEETIAALPPEAKAKRGTVRELAQRFNVPRGRIRRWMSLLGIRATGS